MQLRVGQVIYVVLKKENRVVPMQVTEEITRKTMGGSEITHRVVAGSNVENSLLINQIDGEIFDSPKACEQALVERATRSIQKIVATASSKAREWYVSPANNEAHDQPPALATITKPETHEGTEVQLPDGSIVKARITLPPELT